MITKSVPPTETSAFHLHPLPPSIYQSITIYTLYPIHLHLYPTTIKMFRTAILRSAPSFRIATTPLIRPALTFARPTLTLASRGYAASAGLSKDDISSRVLEVMKTFEKVDGGKVCLSCSD